MPEVRPVGVVEVEGFAAVPWVTVDLLFSTVVEGAEGAVLLLERVPLGEGVAGRPPEEGPEEGTVFVDVEVLGVKVLLLVRCCCCC